MCIYIFYTIYFYENPISHNVFPVNSKITEQIPMMSFFAFQMKLQKLSYLT